MLSVRRAVAIVWTPMLSVVLAWGCTGEPPAEHAPAIDPTLPYVDASWNPMPTQPGRSRGDGGRDSGDGEERRGGDRDDGFAASMLNPGDLLITEVMYDPSGTEPLGEWFELTNTTSEARNLSGLEIRDGANRTHVIAGSVVVGPGDYVVFVRSRAAAVTAQIPPAAIAYEYGAGLADNVGIQLANGTTGAVALYDGGVLIAQAKYGGWFPSPAGASIQLGSMSFEAGADATRWCVSTRTYSASSDKGTPGAPSSCR